MYYKCTLEWVDIELWDSRCYYTRNCGAHYLNVSTFCIPILTPLPYWIKYAIVTSVFKPIKALLVLCCKSVQINIGNT